MDSIELRKAIRSKYAWPGGYPMALAMADGGTVCMNCAHSEYRLIAYANKHSLRDGWKPEAVFINWEDSSLCCDHCGKKIESAYGE
jgi:hypothetical protein